MTGGYYTAIEVVKNYGEYLEDIFNSVPMEYSLNEMSYSRWAITELLDRLEYCLPGDELSTMEQLSNDLVEYSQINTHNNRLFTIALEIVNNAIDLYFET